MSRRRSLLILAVIGLCAVQVGAQELGREERLAIGRQALADQNWELAEEQATAILNRWPDDENGLILKLEAVLFQPSPNAELARDIFGELPRKTRNSDYLQGIDLWMDYNYGSSLMPSIKLVLQLRRAKKLLESDPESTIGNLVAGTIKLEDYRDQIHSVRFPTAANMDQLLADAGSAHGTGSQYIPGQGPTNRETPIVRDESVEKETLEEAISYLVKAAASGHSRRQALRMLGEVSVRGQKYDVIRASAESYIQDFPDQPDAYLMAGLALFLKGHAAEASIRFEAGMKRLSTADLWAFNNPASISSTHIANQFTSESDSSTTDYWARQDHLWSSPSNERMVEHRARVIYADLVWGRPGQNLRGWDTEPGQVVIRYGWPLSQMQFQDEFNQYFILDYGYRSWVFMDLAKADRFTFWSPRGGTFQANRLCDRGRGGIDYEKCAREWFRDDPERTQRAEAYRVKMNTLASIFEDGSQRLAVLPFCFPETDQIPGNQVTIFDRIVGQPIPVYGRAIAFEQREKHWSELPCEMAQVAVQQLDTDAHQLSLEVEGLKGFATSRIDVAPAGQSGLRLSDLLLARLVEEMDSSEEVGITPSSIVTGPAWVRFGKTIYPVARPHFDSGTPIYLYLETYGLSGDSGTDLSFQAALVEGKLEEDLTPKLGRIFGKREKAVVSVEFDQHVQSATDSRYFILETQGVAPGTYVLAVRVLEQRSGRQSVISREIVIK